MLAVTLAESTRDQGDAGSSVLQLVLGLTDKGRPHTLLVRTGYGGVQLLACPVGGALDGGE